MYLRNDGKTIYHLIVDASLKEEIRLSKKLGVKLQPLLREFIKQTIEDAKKKHLQK